MPSVRVPGKKKNDAICMRLGHIEKAGPVNHTKALPKQYPWKVVHACEAASSEVLLLVEGQLAAGMRPSLLTPDRYGSAHSFLADNRREVIAPISLLRSWNHVREWRKLLNESAAENSSDVIHAHSFSAGMAAVRASSGVVYQLREAVEKLAAAAGNCDEHSWLARSFRVAEQFLLGRAAAVVVNNHAARLACLERGIGAENVFLIPEPIRSDLLESGPDRKWLERTTGGGSETIFFLIPGLPQSSSWDCRDSLLRWMRVLSVVRHENTNVRFLFITEKQASNSAEEIATACNLRPWVSVLSPEMRDNALASADVVICDREHAAGGVALESLARGRATIGRRR